MDTLKLRDGSYVELYRAEKGDIDVIRGIYYSVYGEGYTLPEVKDDRRSQEVLEDEDNLWLVARYSDRYVGAVLTLVDRGYGISKLMAGAVAPGYRQKGIFKTMIDYSLDYAASKVDVIYGITRTRDLGPQKTLKYFDFKALGVFPNVRKLKTYETHVLYAKYFNDALERREALLEAIPPVKRFFDIVADSLSLKDRDEIRIVSQPYLVEFEPYNEEVEISYGSIIKEIYLSKKDELTLSFFPFHVPNYYFRGDGWEAFVYYNPVDKHAAIMALRVNGMVNFSRSIYWVADYMDLQGARYLEIVIAADLPNYHRAAYEIGYMPCAFFPAASLSKKKPLREDQVVFCYPLSFPKLAKLRLTQEAHRFIRAYYENLRDKLEEEMYTILVY